jgi:hypothetical protein
MVAGYQKTCGTSDASPEGVTPTLAKLGMLPATLCKEDDKVGRFLGIVAVKTQILQI